VYLVTAYDVVDDRRRRRLQRALAAWLLPVQKSVFEGHLLPPALVPLRRAIGRHIDPATDSVRVFPICEACRRAARLHGTAAPLPEPTAPLFL
jgi:CRISPR-associated protein Cas2